MNRHTFRGTRFYESNGFMISEIREPGPIRMSLNSDDLTFFELKCRGCNFDKIFTRKENYKTWVGLDGYHLYCRVCKKCNKRAIIDEENNIVFVDDFTGIHLECETKGREITLDEINEKYCTIDSNGEKLKLYEID